MLTAGFHGRRFRQEFLPGVLFIPQDHIRYQGCPTVIVPVLSSNTVSMECRGFQAHRRFYEDAVFRRFSRSHHNCHRRGKAPGAQDRILPAPRWRWKGQIQRTGPLSAILWLSVWNDNNRRDKNPAHTLSARRCDRSLGISRLAHRRMI